MNINDIKLKSVCNLNLHLNSYFRLFKKLSKKFKSLRIAINNFKVTFLKSNATNSK